jgi:hypothetical protein
MLTFYQSRLTAQLGTRRLAAESMPRYVGAEVAEFLHGQTTLSAGDCIVANRASALTQT